MTDKSHHKQRPSHRTTSLQNTGLSMMAVQEKLGLFTVHQNHASHTLADTGEANTQTQAVLEEKPLSFM